MVSLSQGGQGALGLEAGGIGAGGTEVLDDF